jgi:gamma-glutamyl hydrolase
MINKFPVIGILSQINPVHKYNYISYAYNKWLLSYGCYTIYININLSDDELTKIFYETDGLLIPGGDEYPYENVRTYKVSILFLNLAMEHGNYPILGICMGLQFMLTYFSNENWDEIKTIVHNYGTSDKLNLTLDKLENNIISLLPKKYCKKKLLNLNHKHAIICEKFYKNKILTEKFCILSTTKTKDIKHEFVSSIQNKEYPFFGLQWHPEKTNYEWSKLQIINRDPESNIISNIIGNFFVEYCKYTNSFTSKALLDKYNIHKLKQHITDPLKIKDIINYDEPLIIYIISL